MAQLATAGQDVAPPHRADEGLPTPSTQNSSELDDGSRVRLLPQPPNHVWSCGFVHDRRHDRGAYRILNIVDEYTREALMIRIDPRLNSIDVLDALSDLFILCSAPAYVRSNNGPAFVARAVRAWVAAVGAEAALLEPPVEQSIHRLDR